MPDYTFFYDPERNVFYDPAPMEDDLDDFLREIYADTGYDDLDLEGMLEEWEGE